MGKNDVVGIGEATVEVADLANGNHAAHELGGNEPTHRGRRIGVKVSENICPTVALGLANEIEKVAKYIAPM
jgi:hypothetical protein